MSDHSARTGEVHHEPGGPTVLRFRRVHPEPVEDVWSAVTDPDRCARWFGRWSGDARPGGTVALEMTAEEDAGGPPSQVLISECDPPHRLAVAIRDGDGEPWELTLTLAPEGTGTVLVLPHVLPAGLSPADAGPGWHWYLDRLAASLAGTPMPDWERTLTATVDHYRA
ncbi:SRPBCC family protein [Pseudonocardia sp. ICBG1293]|uniref:SRPBCC family protein n=1 Tax=Pseudonocardia sp. ICBG1293 TaxID=2844382 RepID=UPI001CC9D712|nr:SRPBCC family protein [Pseudonocardia sp. ICBG1293]